MAKIFLDLSDESSNSDEENLNRKKGWVVQGY